MRVMKIVKWLIFSLSLVGVAAASFLHFHKKNNFTINPNLGNTIPKAFGVKEKEDSDRKGSSMSNSIDKY